MNFVQKVRLHRREQMKANKLDNNYYYKDTDVFSIVDSLKVYIPAEASVLEELINTLNPNEDIKHQIREEINKIKLFGYQLQHESTRYSFKNAPKYTYH